MHGLYDISIEKWEEKASFICARCGLTNSHRATVQDGLTVTEFMRVKDIPFMAAVELNGKYLERKLCHTTVLQDQDKLEFVESLSGG